MSEREYWKDPEFPPNLSILFLKSKHGKLRANDFCFAQWRRKGIDEIEGLVKFIRANSTTFQEGVSKKPSGHNQMQCFQDLVEPDDIIQGKLGNCWFLSSTGSIADDFPDHIKWLFLKQPTMEDSRCIVRLYNPFRGKWETVTIDDYIPVFKRKYLGIKPNTPLFTRPNGLETWVILLEKAMAKFHGGYAFLKGGYARHAMACLTGAKITGWVQVEENYWKKFDIDYDRANDKRPRLLPKQRFFISSSPQSGSKDDKQILKMLLIYLYKNYPIACGFKEKGQGIVTGHSYSFLDMFPKSSRDLSFIRSNKDLSDIKQLQLIKLRNPYAMGEWDGKWSDSDPNWKKYGGLKKYLGVKPADDGTFWMDFDSWRKRVVKIDICHFNGKSPKTQ